MHALTAWDLMFQVCLGYTFTPATLECFLDKRKRKKVLIKIVSAVHDCLQPAKVRKEVKLDQEQEAIKERAFQASIS
jgi:hypothetical protein